METLRVSILAERILPHLSTQDMQSVCLVSKAWNSKFREALSLYYSLMNKRIQALEKEQLKRKEFFAKHQKESESDRMQLESIDKRSLTELRAFSKPPQAVKLIIELVTVLVTGKKCTEWSKTLLRTEHRLLDKLSNFDITQANPKAVREVRKVLKQSDLTEQAVRRFSLACSHIFAWLDSTSYLCEIFHYANQFNQKIEDLRTKKSEIGRLLKLSNP